MDTLKAYQDSLDRVLKRLVDKGLITDNQRLLIYLDLAAEVRQIVNAHRAKEKIEEFK